MMKDPTARLIASFVLGIVVGVSGLWLWQHRALPIDISDDENSLEFNELININNSVASSTSMENEAPGISASVKGQTIRIENQPPGIGVVVAQANLEKPAWIAIHDNNDGKPGNILGARLFDKGKNSGMIGLLRPTEAGRSYIAMLHAYSGIKRPFDAKIDLPVVDKDGNPTVTTFSAINFTN